MKLRTNDILFAIAILFGLWFAGAGIIWVYWFNIFFAFPFGIAALLIWLKLKNDGKKRNKAIPVILITGLVMSLGMLLYIVMIKY